MHIGKKLKAIIESREIQKKELAKEVGISPTYLSGIMSKNSIDCELLEKFCNALHVSPTEFFDVDVTCCEPKNDNSNLLAMQVELSLLRKLADDKERMIQTLLNILEPGRNRDTAH